MVKLKNIEETIEFRIPEHKQEITKEYVDNVLKNVKLAEHYCIIGLIFRGSLTELISVKANKFTIVPILCKFNSDKLSEEDLMQVVSMDRTTVERAQHLYNIKNELSLDSIKKFIDDNNLNKQVLTNRYKAVAIEFKIVPVCDIHAIIGDKYITKSMFKNAISSRSSGSES